MTTRMTITYLQRSETERYQLHTELETVDNIPTFAELRERFGRCEGKVYSDTNTGPVHCGYIFARRERWHDRSIGWDDPQQFYTAETWVTFERVEVAPVDLDQRP